MPARSYLHPAPLRSVVVRAIGLFTCSWLASAHLLALDAPSSGLVPSRAEFPTEAPFEPLPDDGSGTAGFAAENPWQRFDVHIRGEVVTVAALPEHEPAWMGSLQLVGIGRRIGGIDPPPAAEPKVTGDRLEYRRGAVLESYENDARGLTQVITIAERPAGGDSYEVVLDFRLRTDLRPEGDGEPLGLRFRDADGAVRLHYTGLLIQDARNRQSYARRYVTEREDGMLRIGLDDRDLTYPVRVRMALFAGPRFSADDLQPEESADFGTAVAIDGDTAVVGARHSEIDSATLMGVDGAVYVYERREGAWRRTQKLSPPDDYVPWGDSEKFGEAVAIDGDVLVVGAPGEYILMPDGARRWAGAAHVYERRAGVWSHVAQLRSPTPDEGDVFGSSVAVSGNTIAVGSWNDRMTSGGYDGSVTVFVRQPVGWVRQAYLLPEGLPKARTRFGHSLGLEGDMIVSGSPIENDFGAERVGAVYTFVRSGTRWSAPQRTTVVGGREGDRFGFYVALDQRRLVATVGTRSVVFRREGGRWVEEARLPGDVPAGPLTIEDDMVVVGAPAEFELGNRGGAAYVFARDGGSWVRKARLVAPDVEPLDNFGSVVGLSRGRVIVGTASGEAAYLFDVVPQRAEADVMVSLDQHAWPCGAVTLLTYRIWVGNAGPEAAVGAVVRDTLPVRALFYDAHASRGRLRVPQRWGNGTVEWHLDAIEPGAGGVAELTVRAFAREPGRYGNRVRVGSTSDDPAPANNTAGLEHEHRPGR